MEDKKRKKEDKRKREASQKAAEQKNKDLIKSTSAQSLTTPSSASPSPGPGPSSSPSPATAATGGPSQGGNNAKRSAVANGQPPTGGQGTQRYMPREVPPRFRSQQDHKVLLKRGQPPLSCMLLGGGNSGGTTQPLSLGDSPSATVAAASDSGPGSSGLAAPTLPHTSSSSSSSVAASSTISSSNYANSTWGASSGSQPLSQGWEKVIVDRSDLEEWPSIGAGVAAGDGAKVAIKETGGSPWSDRHLQQRAGKGGHPGSPLLPLSSSPNECAQLGSSAWGGSSSQAVIGGGGAGAGSVHSRSKASPLPGNLGANFNPNANPSAWPALVHDGATAADSDPTPLPKSSSLPANPSLSQTPPSGNTFGHQLQVHQIQAKDREAPCGEWGSTRLEHNTGPKKAELGVEDEMDRGGAGGGDLATSSSSSSASSLCRVLPLSSNPKMGASRTDAWEGGTGGTPPPGDTGNVSGYSSKDGNGGVGGTENKVWEAGSGGSCKASGVSQGELGETEEAELSVGEWGSTGGEIGTGGSGNLVTGGSCGSSTSSSSSGSVRNPGTPSPATAATGNFDNQKGAGDGGVGESDEWGGQGRPGGGGASSSCGSGHSRAGGGPHGQHQGNTHQPPKAEVALQNLLSRADLDPRVLSNSGWGQTQIRQNVAWDLEGDAVISSTGMSSAGLTATYPATTDPSAASHLLGGPQKANLEPNAAGLSNGEGWDSSNNSISAVPPSVSSTRNPGTGQCLSSGGSVGGSGNPANSQGKLPGGWGGVGPSENLGKGWGNEGQDWRERRGGAEPGGWGDFGQQGTTTSGGGTGWGGGQGEKGTGGWNDKGKEVGGWGPRGGGDWEKREAKVGSKGRGEGKGSSGDSDVGMWSSWDEGGCRRGWDGGGGGGSGEMGNKHQQGWGGNALLPQLTNSQASVQQQQSQIQLQDTGATRGGWGRPGGLPSQNQNQSSGWTSGPIPQGLGGPSEGPEPSGWEEPSPQSVSRRMEIDDGTSAWGDPNHYNYKNVNLWGKNGAPPNQSQPLNSPASTQQQLGPSNPQQQPATGRLAHQPAVAASRDSNTGPGRNSVMGWCSGGTPSSPVDNGTAAWGKPIDATPGWGDLEDSGKPSGWGNPSPSTATGSKSMQDGWGEGGSSVSASRHSSWEEEEEPGGVWSSTGSQGSNSSYNSGGWGQGHTGKKGNSKGALKGGNADSWMNPMTRQFSNMGLLSEDPNSRSLDLAPGPVQDKKLDGEKRGMNDYNGEMRKGGRGGGGAGGTVFRSSSSKDVGPSEPGPYYDKMVGHNVFGSSSGMAQSRGVLQPGVLPINPSPSLRAQVPQQLLSPQVPGSVLKQMPPPNSSVGGVGGIGGGVFPAYLSPQHIAMLSSIYPTHLQLQLACQLLLQQQTQQPQQQQQPQQFLQNQRKFQQNIRQQPDPQQLARIVAVLHQQRQQQVGVPSGSSKLSPSHLGGGHSKQPMADSLPHPGLGGSLSDQLNPKTLGGYPGFGSGINMSGLEMGSMVGGPTGAKEGGQQSRFKWMMEGHSPAPSPPQSGLHKNGPIAAPVKLRDSSPYSHYDLIGNDSLPVPPQDPSDNWHRTPGKMASKSSGSSWPPEFQPGVPWKGVQSADPESDPYVTPGSVLGPSGASNLNDTEHQLLRDNTEPNPSLNTLLPSHGAWPYSASDSPLNNTHNPAKYTEYKPSWPPDPIGHNKLWKANRNSSQLPRPPPGLSHQKQPSPSPWSGGAPRLAKGWGGSGGSQENRYGPGSSWSDSGASRTSCWLLLSNLTPQIDGSTLRTICMQHGPLLTFHLGLTQGSALIRYSSRQEAAKAQGALHMCVLGNTTILAEFVSDEEVSRYFAHSQVGGSGGGASVTAPGVGGGQGSSGSSTVGANSGGSTPGNERERERPGTGGGGMTGGSNNGGGGLGGMGSPCAGWQGLDGTGNSPDPSVAQGPGLSVFTQWSSNGAIGGGVGTGGVGSMEPGRQTLWGGMTPSYPSSSSSLWGASPMEDRHQMGSPAALLPGDLLGGGTDSI